MTVLTAKTGPEGFYADGGPFVAIGLSQEMALPYAGARAVVSVLPQEIPLAGLHLMDEGLILCPLLGETADALDILADLADVGYRGRVVVLAPPLPDPAMVERELAEAAPGMTVSLLVV